jgi:hypothetical protein
MIYFSQTYRLEHLETGEKTIHALSENLDQDSPRSTVGCTPYECHVGLKENNDVGPKGNNESTPMDVKLREASHFLHQFSQDTGLVQGRQLEERLEEIKIGITRCGTYVHSFDEIEYGTLDDDAQLQVNKAILHSFARNGVSCVDHHFASDSFLEFFSSELRKRGNCPGSLLYFKRVDSIGVPSCLMLEFFLLEATDSHMARLLKNRQHKVA